MVIIDYQRAELLFTKFDLRASLEAGRQALFADANSAPITADSSDDELDKISTALSDKHSVSVPVLKEDDIFTSSERRSRDVSQDFDRAIFDRSRPSMLETDAIVFHVPFSGERELFFMRASTYSMNPPRAEVADQELRIVVLVEGTAEPDEVKPVFQQELLLIRQALDWVGNDLGANYTETLLQQARSELEAKRNRLASTRGLLDGLGFKNAPAQQRMTTAQPTASPTPKTRAAVPLPEQSFAYDFFISHASEDKDEIARPLFAALLAKGYQIWFDEAELRLGDSLLTKIDEGLANCRFGIVVMSPRFFDKKWTNEELNGLRSRQVNNGPAIILPIWKDIDVDFLNRIHPSLAQIKAVNFTDGLEAVVAEIEHVYRR